MEEKDVLPLKDTFWDNELDLTLEEKQTKWEIEKCCIELAPLRHFYATPTVDHAACKEAYPDGKKPGGIRQIEKANKTMASVKM